VGAPSVEAQYGWIRLAIETALQSPDPSTQNAAFLVSPTGNVHLNTLEVNRFPNGVDESAERWERPTKYAYVEHAERNAIYRAAGRGICTNGLTMVAVWAACADCARAIIQAGIVHLIRYYSTDDHALWDESIARADEMMAEARVRITTLTAPIEGCEPILRNGELWLPQGER
jgi:dCMP deaminase